MSKIDPRLKYLKTQEQDNLLELETLGRFGLEVENVPIPKVRVLVQSSGDENYLKEKGLEITSTCGDVFAGLVELDKVDALARGTKVARIESSRPLTSELDVSVPIFWVANWMVVTDCFPIEITVVAAFSNTDIS